MNPQSPGTGGRGPYDSWGRPYGASRQPGPQQPGPEYVYEMPEDFQEQQSTWQDSANGNAQGRSQGAKPAPDAPGAGSWSVGPSDSPIPGMSAKDFQKMCRSVDKAFSQFARMVDQGVNEAAEALGQSPEKNLKAHKELQEKRKREKKARKAQEEAQRRAAQQAYGQQRYGQPGYGASQGAPTGGVPQGFRQAVTSAAQQAQQWAPLAKAKKRFRSSWGLTASGVVMAAAGGAGTVFFGIPALVSALAPAVAGNPEVAVTAILGILTAGFATLLGFGIRNLRRASKLKALQRAVGQREAVGFDDLAARMQVSPKAALAASRTLIKGGYLPEGRIDDENTTLMVTENAYHQYRQFQQSQRQTLAEREAAEAARAAEAAARAAHEQDLSERLTPEQRAFVACGRDYLRQLRSLDERINDAAVSERIVAIEEVVGRILARAEEEPAVIAGLDRLTAYYLPTTVKLLGAYEELDRQPVQGENIVNSKKEIEASLDTLNVAFENLLDGLFKDTAWDVSTDISVLHTMLAQEGLTGKDF